MDHAAAMRVVERAGDRRRELHCFVHGQLLLSLEARAKALALDVRHHVEQQITGDTRVEQRQQVRMLQVRGDLDLRLKAVDADDGTEVRTKDLERDATVMA